MGGYLVIQFGRVQMKAAAHRQMAVGRNAIGPVKVSRPIALLPISARVAAILPRRLMAPRSRQARMCGPTVRCCSSQRSNLGLLREKQKAAKIQKTTVGSSGTAMPMKPIPTASQPRTRKKPRRTSVFRRDRDGDPVQRVRDRDLAG